jgi:glycosyltransferase involved in cell wall biosynthesis
LIELDPERRLDRTISKLGILRQIMTPRLLRLRKRWTTADTVLVMSWYLLPVMLLVQVRVLRRPRRLVSMGAFVHDPRVRQIVNLLLRLVKIDELEFIVFSEAERRNLIETVGLPSARVHRVVYRGKSRECTAAPEPDEGYIFTGGYSNRDYETFFAAVGPLRDKVVAVASALNNLGDPPPNVTLRLDISWDEFEELIEGCALLVLPLREGGEACGQGVLVRGIQHTRPVVATRHDSLIDYLGTDYSGFVPARDPNALRIAIERGLRDLDFRGSLLERVRAAAGSFREQEHVDTEIAGILAN